MDSQWFWYIAAALITTATIQIVYLLWLTYRLRREDPAIPSHPIFPDADNNSSSPDDHKDLAAGSVGRIIVLNGVPEPGEIALPGSNFGIGRFYNEEANILLSLDEPSVSRRHAVFTLDESARQYFVQDTNSSYGTAVLIDDQFQPLSPDKRERVYNEDVVQIGKVVKLRLILPCETRAVMARP